MRSWADHAPRLASRQPYRGGVAVANLRPGFDMVLCDLGEGDEEPFRHQEADDLIGLGFHLKGGARFDFETEGFSTRAGDCWIAATPRGATSTFSIGSIGFRTLSLRFSPDGLAALLADQRPFPRLAARGRNAVALRPGRALDMHRAAAVEALFATPHDGAIQRLLLESAALSLLAWQMIEADAEPAASPELSPRGRARMDRARERLDAELDDPPSLIRLARDLGTNDFQLKQDFKRAFGTTVFGYVRDQRMRRAAEHLRQGLSVQQAALDVGYVCPSRFAQAFRRRYGVAPGAFSRPRMV